ncbi:MAG: hypothetical protein ACJ8GW_08805 [Massilia sp.]
MAYETPFDAMMRWFRTPGTAQTALRWLALIPGVIGVVLLWQLTVVMVLSIISLNGSPYFYIWVNNLLNAGCVPFLVIVFVTPIAPAWHRQVSILLALVAVCLVAVARWASELSVPDMTPERYGWIVIGALVCWVSAGFGIRRIFRSNP